MREQNGFTLIEALTTSALAGIVGFALLTVLYMTNGQIKDGTSTLRLGRLQTVATEQIHRSVRQAGGVWQLDVTPTLIDTNFTYPGSPTLPRILGVLLCAPSGDTLAGYSVIGDSLRELDTLSGTWKPFKVAGEAVTVDEDNSYFGILKNRRGVVSRIQYTLDDGDSVYTFPPLADTIRCRNTTRNNSI
jgi:type II secretory pathway pseudopilin PulG